MKTVPWHTTANMKFKKKRKYLVGEIENNLKYIHIKNAQEK